MQQPQRRLGPPLCCAPHPAHVVGVGNALEALWDGRGQAALGAVHQGGAQLGQLQAGGLPQRLGHLLLLLLLLLSRALLPLLPLREKPVHPGHVQVAGKPQCAVAQGVKVDLSQSVRGGRRARALAAAAAAAAATTTASYLPGSRSSSGRSSSSCSSSCCLRPLPCLVCSSHWPHQALLPAHPRHVPIKVPP